MENNNSISNQEQEESTIRDATPPTDDQEKAEQKSPMITGTAFDGSKEQDMDDLVHSQQEDGSLPDPESLSANEDAETYNDLPGK